LQVLETFTSFHTRATVYQVVVAALLIPYLSIRQLKLLSPFSLLANILTVVGLAITLQYCFQDLPSVTERPAVANVDTLALYFGIVVFTFEVRFIRCPRLAS
jgi:proton-coupled amino acid transporter